jgi:hypothetical protein
LLLFSYHLDLQRLDLFLRCKVPKY